MKTTIKRWAILAIGWLFVLFGIVGLFLPVLQGILFLLIGLLILSSEYVWAHNLLQTLRARFPTVAAKMDEASHKARQWKDRILHRGRASRAPEAEAEPKEKCG